MRDKKRKQTYDREYHRAYRLRPGVRERKIAVSRAHQLSKFGITPGQYETMLEAQGGVCAICYKPPKNFRLAVDHDHHTGRVRGLLCWWCNHKVVATRNTSDILRKAADYLDSDFDGRLL